MFTPIRQKWISNFLIEKKRTARQLHSPTPVCTLTQPNSQDWWQRDRMTPNLNSNRSSTKGVEKQTWATIHNSCSMEDRIQSLLEQNWRSLNPSHPQLGQFHNRYPTGGSILNVNHANPQWVFAGPTTSSSNSSKPRRFVLISTLGDGNREPPRFS